MGVGHVHECSVIGCREEGKAGFGIPPRWLCLEHFDEEAAAIGDAMRRAKELLGGR